MTAISSSHFFQRRKSQYVQHGPPWSASLWIAALAAAVVNHLYCSSLHGQDVSRSSPAHVASVQRFFSLFVELCLICSNTAVMFHIVYRSSRRRPDVSSLPSYIVPIITFLILVCINVALIVVHMAAPAALVAITSTEHATACYHYSPPLLFLTYGVALSLVSLTIAAGTVVSWGFGHADESVEQGPLLGLSWDEQNARSRD